MAKEPDKEEVDKDEDHIVMPTKEELDNALAGEEVEEKKEVVKKEEEKKEGTAEVVDPWEKQALGMGWNPEFDGDPDKKVSAEEFVKRTPLYETISKQKKVTKRLQGQLDALTDHHKGVKEAAYEQAKKDLKAERIEAINEGRGEDVVALEEKENKLDKDHKVDTLALSKEKELGSVPIGESSDKELEEYAKEWVVQTGNEWFKDNPDMAAYANGIGQRISEENPDLPMEDFFEAVTKKTKEFFDDKSEPEKIKDKPKVSAISKTNRRTVDSDPSSSDKLTFRELDPIAKKVGYQLIKTANNPGGIMTEEEYLTEYALKNKHSQ